MFSADKKKIDQFLKDVLLDSFPTAGRPIVASLFRKHMFELEQILQTARKQSPLPASTKFLDIGCGIGVNAIVLKQLFNFDAYVVDRLDEFAPELNREVGDTESVLKRWERFGVKGGKLDFIRAGFPSDWHVKFDIVTNFDVIEHFTFSPIPFLKSCRDLLSPSGTLMIGTPNQVHLYNRIKALIGRNTWEDFQYFIECSTFYGHVREFTPQELQQLLTAIGGFSAVDMAYSSYPIQDREHALATRFGRLPALLFTYLLRAVFSLNPNFHYYMIGIGTQKN